MNENLNFLKRLYLRASTFLNACFLFVPAIPLIIIPDLLQTGETIANACLIVSFSALAVSYFNLMYSFFLSLEAIDLLLADELVKSQTVNRKVTLVNWVTFAYIASGYAVFVISLLIIY